jgi:hypothetical protein
MSGKVGLWFLRKAVYVAAGTALAVLANQLQGAGPTGYDLGRLTLAGVTSGLGAAVVGDLRRALLPDVLQVATGEDPRKDG